MDFKSEIAFIHLPKRQSDGSFRLPQHQETSQRPLGVTTAGSDCGELPLKTTEEAEAVVSLAASNRDERGCCSSGWSFIRPGWQFSH